MYVVAQDAPTDGDVYLYAWFFEWEFGQLLAADGTFPVLAELTQPLGGRYDPTVALVPGAAIAKVASAIMRGVDPEVAKDMVNLADAELAAELAAWIVTVLPGPDELSTLYSTQLTAQSMLRRTLVASHTGTGSIVTPLNVLNVIPHKEPALLVIGTNAGGTVALSQAAELLRLALDRAVG